MTTLSIESLQKCNLAYGTALSVATFLVDFIPSFLIILLLMRIPHNVWWFWVLAVLAAPVAAIAVNKTNGYLLGLLIKRLSQFPQVKRFKNRYLQWFPRLTPIDPTEYPNLSRLMEDPRTKRLFETDSVIWSVGRDLMLKNDPEANKEWLMRAQQSYQHALLIGLVLSPLLLWPSAALFLFFLLL